MKQGPQHVLSRRGLRIDLANQGSVVNEVSAVSKTEHFLDLRRDEQDRGALGREIGDSLVDAPAGPDIDTAARFIENDDVRVAQQPFPEQHFLLVAAGIGGNIAVDIGGRDAEIVDQRPHAGFLQRRPNDAAGHAEVVKMRQLHVSSHRQRHYQALLAPVFRHQNHTAFG